MFTFFLFRKYSLLLYLLSYFTTVPLQAAKLRGPNDAFKKVFKKFFFYFLKRDDIIGNTAKAKSGFSCDLFSMHQGRAASSNQTTRGRIVNKAKRIRERNVMYIND